MALKTNSKIVLEKIHSILVDCNNFAVEGCGYDFHIVTDWKEAAKNIYKEFLEEKAGDYRFKKYPENVVFMDWMQGLPSMCCVSDDIFLHSAVDFVGGLLEETETEKARFTEEEAEKLAVMLIYREIKKGVEK